MGKPNTILRRKASPPPVHISLEKEGARDLAFTTSFCIGRDEACEVCVPSGEVSRRHAEVCYENGAWWLRDLGSTNGIYVEGERVQELRLEPAPVVVSLGKEGPRLTLTADRAPAARSGAAADASPVRDVKPVPPDGGESSEAARSGAAPAGRRGAAPLTQDAPPAGERSPGGGAATRSGPPDAPGPGPFHSTQAYVDYYFGAGAADRPAGEHTQMIRRAYTAVHRRHRKRYLWGIGAALLVCVMAVSYAFWQQQRAERVEQVFYDLREQDAEIARIRIALEERYDASLAEQLEALEARRSTQRERYDGYIQEYGIRRELSEEERVIFKVARIFNESHTEMPPAFVRAVREQIRVWQTTGRGTFVQGIRYAEEQGYTGTIVRTMQRYDLPPEFFYLALQESAFRTEAVGPWTRFGHAKGMWQFIPETARMYGLEPGPREAEGVYDEQDDRHDFEKSTDAAARYLRDIYGYLAQASGLLAMASYNWGERRVIGKLEQLMEGIPDDPQARSYWRFYSVYSDRMPQQTKDYVIKIFSAAVIGENPRLFGFDFDNPLRKYMEVRPAGIS